MANISDAQVTITAKRCAVEAIAYIAQVQGDAEYNIISQEAFDDIDYEQTEVQQFLDYGHVDLMDNSMSISAYASGRWSYQGNIESYFREKDYTPGKGSAGFTVGNWRQTTGDDNANDINDYLYETLRQKLLSDNEAFLQINWVDVETGSQFISKGVLTLDGDNIDEDVSQNIKSEDRELSIENLMEMSDYDQEDAINKVYGSELAELYNCYTKLGGEKTPDELADKTLDSDLWDMNVKEIKELAEEVIKEEKAQLS